ncbi:SDR family NAD(P)-dependent oxidoreductase [Aeribacillus pallidus]|jgi:uncharacterized protein|uniref:SDR family NAD(P)-dependent oxidoreductase n=1 Tax=Aeribacillus pallidus TaxID=33936 RepID=UPI003D1D0D41
MLNPWLKGKRVVITGASSGIGKEMALLAAGCGAHVILLARREEKLREIANQIEQEQGSVTVMALDVTDSRQVEEVFTKLLTMFPKIDVLINNAGFGLFQEIVDMKMEDVHRMFDVNVLGLIACTRQVIPHMKANQCGHIINIASQAGKIATPKSSVYAATKHAVLGFTNSLRLELQAFGVFVTAVNPGPIDTDFFAIADESGTYVKNVKRWMLRPEQVAEAVIACLGTNRREINMPRWMNVGSKLYQLFPSLVERLGKRAFFQK